MINVDLISKVITADQKVFMVRPGSHYKLYNLFLESEAIIVDFLGLELTNGTPFEEQENMIAQLHRARKLRAYHRLPDEVAPPREIEPYLEYENDRSIAQLYRIMKGYFQEAKKGDLVVVPSRTFGSDALIGELTTEPEQLFATRLPALYGNEQLFGRKVRWIGRIRKGKMSPYMLDLFSKPNAFVLVPKAERLAIYREAYGSYILPNEFRASFNTNDAEFTTTDDLYIQSFFNFVAANSRRIGNGDELIGIKAAAFEKLGEYRLELQSNINSPGFLNLISTKASPLVAQALLLLALSVGPEAVAAAETGTLFIGNSLDPDGDCTVAVREEVYEHLKLLGVNKWSEACDIIRDAADSTGLSSQGKIVIDED